MPENPTLNPVKKERPAPLNNWPLNCYCGYLTHNVGIDNSCICVLPCGHLVCDDCFEYELGVEEWSNCPNCHELFAYDYFYQFCKTDLRENYYDYLIRIRNTCKDEELDTMFYF